MRVQVAKDQAPVGMPLRVQTFQNKEADFMHRLDLGVENSGQCYQFFLLVSPGVLVGFHWRLSQCVFCALAWLQFLETPAERGGFCHVVLAAGTSSYYIFLSWFCFWWRLCLEPSPDLWYYTQSAKLFAAEYDIISKGQWLLPEKHRSLLGMGLTVPCVLVTIMFLK